MKYEIKFTNQFKKDLKLAKKQNWDLDKLFDAVKFLRMAAHWMQNIATMTCPAIIRGQENATLNRIGY